MADDSTGEGVEYLTLRDLLGLVKALTVGPVRDLGLLDSAAHRPRSSFAGQQAYPTVPAKAAALMHSVVCNHALVDGNKRLGLLAAVVFLRLNGQDLDLDDDEVFDLTVSVAAGRLSADDIEKRLRHPPYAAIGTRVTRPVPATDRHRLEPPPLPHGSWSSREMARAEWLRSGRRRS